MEAMKGVLVRDMSADHQLQMIVDQDTDEEYGGGSSSNDKKQKGAGIRSARGVVGAVAFCQAERCGADLSEAKKYHRRHKVCKAHSKAAFAIVAGLKQRFCQQCSRFHELSEFDEAKRSCRRRLAGHNERRRKNAVDCGGEASAPKTLTSKEALYNGDGSAKFHATFSGNPHYNKLYHIR